MNQKSKLTIIIVILTIFYISSNHFTQAKSNNGQLSKLIIKSLENWHYSGKLLNSQFTDQKEMG